MNVVGRQRIDDFCARHNEARSRMNAWLLEAEDAVWLTPNDVKSRFRTASFLAENRVVFNIGGNRFRLVVKIAYGMQTVLVQLVGTHEEYDTWKL